MRNAHPMLSVRSCKLANLITTVRPTHLMISASRYYECHYSKDMRKYNYGLVHAYITDNLLVAQVLASSQAYHV